MVVWGGVAFPTYFNTGGRYTPGTNGWTAISTANAPSQRRDHTAVWTGSEMIVWGGTDDTTSFNTGGSTASKLFQRLHRRQDLHQRRGHA